MKVVFIDDERFPTDATNVVIRNYDQFVQYVTDCGFPDVIHFDHDLGDNEPTGYDIAKYIVDGDINGIHVIPEHFKFHIHSQNPIGKKNIESLLNNYMDFKFK